MRVIALGNLIQTTKRLKIKMTWFEIGDTTRNRFLYIMLYNALGQKQKWNFGNPTRRGHVHAIYIPHSRQAGNEHEGCGNTGRDDGCLSDSIVQVLTNTLEYNLTAKPICVHACEDKSCVFFQCALNEAWRQIYLFIDISFQLPSNPSDDSWTVDVYGARFVNDFVFAHFVPSLFTLIPKLAECTLAQCARSLWRARRMHRRHNGIPWRRTPCWKYPSTTYHRQPQERHGSQRNVCQKSRRKRVLHHIPNPQR